MIDLGLIGELLPYAGKLSKAMGTLEKLMADPDVKDMIATAKEVSAIIAQHEAKGTANAKGTTGTSPGGAIG